MLSDYDFNHIIRALFYVLTILRVNCINREVRKISQRKKQNIFSLLKHRAQLFTASLA